MSTPIDISVATPSYPMLSLVVRHGGWASIAIGLGIALLALWCGYLAGSVIVTVLGLVAAGLGYVLARTLVELVRLITDMLLPK
jgi:hypothetical protein